MDTSHLAPDEPLSPELVLVLPPELRAQAIARLGPFAPVRPAPRFRVIEAPAPTPAPYVEPETTRSLGVAVAARVAQLGLIFVAVTLIVIAMSLVADALATR